MPPIPQTTFRELAERHSTILFDAYGVLAGSNFVEPEAPAAIEFLHSLGKPYFVLTNDSSALAATRAASYKSLGLPIDESRIITSGSLLEGYFAEHDLADSRCIVLGPPDSVRYVEAAGGRAVPYGSDFDVLVIGDQSGFPFLEAADTVLSAIFRKIDTGKPVTLSCPTRTSFTPKAKISVSPADRLR